MKDSLHTVLGSTGPTGEGVIEALEERKFGFRTVSRSLNKGAENHVQADLLVKEEADAAIAGSEFVYLCVGLPYSYKVWARDWERLMQNVIDACEKHSAKLIFLDNIYMYGSPLPIPFDENTAQGPVSKKGAVRKRVADKLLKAIEEGRVNALIARSADFYGKRATTSVLYVSFLERILAGKNPQWLSAGNVKHTYANVGDNGRAMVELALSDDCYKQVWHLPVGQALTMEEILSIYNGYLGKEFKSQVMPGFMKGMLSLFIPILKEAREMQYQFEKEYVMSFEKFRKRFPDFKVTSYEEGLSEMVDWFNTNS